MADILVVDDDEVIRETLDELLSASYSCQTADTAEAALAKLEAHEQENGPLRRPRRDLAALPEHDQEGENREHCEHVVPARNFPGKLMPESPH